MTIWCIACTMHCETVFHWNTPDQLQEWSWLSSHCLRWDGAYSKRCTEMGLLMISKSIYWTLSKVLYGKHTNTQKYIYKCNIYETLHKHLSCNKSWQIISIFNGIFMGLLFEFSYHTYQHKLCPSYICNQAYLPVWPIDKAGHTFLFSSVWIIWLHEFQESTKTW